MTTIPQSLSLTHQIRPPADDRERPPVLIMLHGYGSNSSDLMGLSSFLDPRLLVVSVDAPHALGGGARAWYSLEFTGTGISENQEEAQNSLEHLKLFVREVLDAYQPDPQRIYFSGFSQGSIMSLAITLTDPEIVAGAALLSGKVPDFAADLAAPNKRLAGIPIYAAHGLHDKTIPIAWGREQRDFLAKRPFALTYREFDMAHEVTMESLSEVTDWIGGALNGPRRITATQ